MQIIIHSRNKNMLENLYTFFKMSKQIFFCNC